MMIEKFLEVKKETQINRFIRNSNRLKRLTYRHIIMNVQSINSEKNIQINQFSPDLSTEKLKAQKLWNVLK